MASTLFTLLALEGALRLTDSASDVAFTYFHEQLGNHYRPNQSGTYRRGRGPEIEVPFSINAQGWNAPYDYEEGAFDGLRIAVIGDSYVEAFQVSAEDNFAAVLEERLTSGKCPELDPTTGGDVLRLGHSGVGFPQYINVASWALQVYRPDWLVFNVVRNDFSDSLFGPNTSEYRTFELGAGGLVAREPIPRVSLRSLFGGSALVRFVWVNHNFPSKWRRLVRFVQGRAAPVTWPEPQLWFTVVVERFFSELRALQQEHGFRTVVAFSFDSLYESGEPQEPSPLRPLLLEAAAAHEVDTLDLDPTFAAARERDGRAFTFASDGHWNAYAHGLVGEAVADRLCGLP